MRLDSISFVEFEGTDQEWRMDDLLLGPRNLIVGKNASGKTRAINIIAALARHLAGQESAGFSGRFNAVFSDGVKRCNYQLHYLEQEVISESVIIDSKPLLTRGAGGEGTIYAADIDGGTQVRFQAPPKDIAAFVRRDTIQHAFLETLNAWASSVRRYNFGTQLGKDHLAVFVEKGGVTPDERDPNAVVALFRQGQKQFGVEFEKAIHDDLKEVGYEVEQITVGPMLSMRFFSIGSPEQIPQFVGLLAKEKGLKAVTDQNAMSQGMFRVLSLLIQINFCDFSKKATCFLIDDVGEGLDFDRSCRLIDLLRKKAETSGVQLVLTTNDRFVMNRVPLEEWSVLNRVGSIVTVRNIANSKKIFEDFKFTGLSNFSFLELDVLNDPHAGDPAANA